MPVCSHMHAAAQRGKCRRVGSADNACPHLCGGHLQRRDVVVGAVLVALEHRAVLAQHAAAPKAAVQAGRVHHNCVLDVVPVTHTSAERSLPVTADEAVNAQAGDTARIQQRNHLI